MIQTHGTASLLEMDAWDALFPKTDRVSEDPANPRRAHEKQRNYWADWRISRDELELSLRIFREQTRLRNRVPCRKLGTNPGNINLIVKMVGSFVKNSSRTPGQAEPTAFAIG